MLISGLSFIAWLIVTPAQFVGGNAGVDFMDPRTEESIASGVLFFGGIAIIITGGIVFFYDKRKKTSN